MPSIEAECEGMFIPGGKVRRLCAGLVQNAAEGKTSYKKVSILRVELERKVIVRKQTHEMYGPTRKKQPSDNPGSPYGGRKENMVQKSCSAAGATPDSTGIP